VKVPIRYSTLVWTAIVAAVFSLVVGLLMTLDFVGRGKYELFDTREYQELKQQLKDQPGDARLQQAIRELDLHLRDAYFRNRRFMATGMYMLLGGMALALIAARWAVSVRSATYQPRPVDLEADEELLTQRYARWATVGVVAIVTAVLCGFALRAEPIVPAGTAQLASEPTAKPPALAPVEKDGSAKAHPAPEIAPGAAAALPSYDDYVRQWPRFRGPTGSGVSQFTDIPAQWSVPANTGIVWKTAVPLPGPNSPVVWRQRVFLSGATAEEQAVFCFDATGGELQWRHDLPPTKPESGELEVMEATGYAAPTIATDGLRVYAIFATGDVVALSLEGQELWHKNFGVPKNPYGHASSLATYNDLLIVQLDQATEEDGLSRLLALRGATGETAWEVKRPVPCSWASPIVVEHGGRWMLITCVNPWLIAYSPADGSELWRAKCLGGEVGPSPVFVDGVVYAANEASGLAAVRADGTGDVTQTHIQWTTEIDVPDVCSPLVTDKFVLLMAHGMLACFDRAPGAAAADGRKPREPLWEEDLLEEVSSSPSQVGNFVYLFSEEGKAWIIEPQANACGRVGEFEMGEPVRSSPAFQPGRIYIRGQEHLFCIGTK
jgi:outer membrane protein assembly factor BamB